MSAALTMTVNGAKAELACPPGRRLSEALRTGLGLTSVKTGCDAGDCGACTVLLDGHAICACLTPAARAEGRNIDTAEGLAGDTLSALQGSFLRHGAAQCGICTPGMLMAASALLANNPAPSRQEAEAALGGVLCRCTGYAKIIDAVCDVTLPAGEAMPLSGNAVGTAVPRLDGLKKVNGAEIFGADHCPSNALHVRAIRSPHARAAFAFGDLDAWRKARPGLIAVFTAADVPGRNRFGVIPAFADQPALAEQEARFRGEAVALIAGERTAIERFDPADFPVTWTPLEPISDPQAALLTGAHEVFPGRAGNVLVRGRVAKGEPQTAIAKAAHVVTGQMQTRHVEHAYIEPEAGTAWMEGETLIIHACTQAPYMDRDDTAAILGLRPEQVRIIPSATGGGFGSKLDISLQPLIGLVAIKTGRPAFMAYSRAESMMSTTKRHPASMQATIAADADGYISGMTFAGDFDTGPYSSWGPTVANRVPVHASGPYRTPAYLAETRAVLTNGPVSGAFRGFGVPQAAVLQETLYDKLAEACGLDPLDFRRRNALEDGDRSVCGQSMQDAGIAECLDALKPHWARAKAEADAFNASSSVFKRGAGLASCWYGCGNTGLPNPSTMRIGITKSGEIRLHQGATDIGQGSNTVIAQIAADALGVPLSAITLVGPDTALTPDCGKTSASRQTFVTGNAAVRAATALRETILRLANLGPEAETTLEAGKLTVRFGQIERRIDLENQETGPDGYVLSAQETWDPPVIPLDADGQGAPYAAYGYGAQLAEVEVDTQLGTVKVLRMTAAHDVGRAINPMLAEGQIEGGIAQGLGFALMEDYVAGRTENLHDYLIPTTGDMPEIRSILVEKPDRDGPFGAKGLGEHVLIPTAPAILNAIRRACGADISQLPALPHRVLAAIRASEAQNG